MLPYYVISDNKDATFSSNYIIMKILLQTEYRQVNDKTNLFQISVLKSIIIKVQKSFFIIIIENLILIIL